MSYTPLFPEFWSDPDVVELEPDHKLVLLYLFSNPNITLSGIYAMSPAVASKETGVDRASVEKFFNNYRNVFNDNEKMILVAKLLRRNKSGNPNWKKKGLQTEYEASKDSSLWKEFFKIYPEHQWLSPGMKRAKPPSREKIKKLATAPPGEGDFVTLEKPSQKKPPPPPPGDNSPEPPKSLSNPESAPIPKVRESSTPISDPPAPDPAVRQSEWELISQAYNKITGLKTGMMDVIKISKITKVSPAIIAYALCRLHFRMTNGGFRRVENPIGYVANIIKKRMVLPGASEGGDEMCFKDHYTVADWFQKAGVIIKGPSEMSSLADVMKRIQNEV